MKNRKLIALILVVATALLLFTACSGNSAPALEDKNGFNESTNVDYEFDNFVFSMPSYFGSERTTGNSTQLYAETDGAVMMIQFQSTDIELEDSDLEVDIVDEWSNSFFEGVSKSFENTKFQENTDLSNDDFVIRKQHVTGETNDLNFEMELYIIASRQTHKVVSVIAGQSEGVEFNYLPDVEKMVLSISEKTEEISTDFKQMMDSYEEFFDGYIEFMQNYSTSGDIASMMNDYLNYMTKYSEVMQEMGNVNTDELSAADYAYYLEVTTRITEKLAILSFNT